MLYCPQCLAEYRPDSAACTDCHVTLVEGEAPEPDALRFNPETRLGGPGTRLLVLFSVLNLLSASRLGVQAINNLRSAPSAAAGVVEIGMCALALFVGLEILAKRHRSVLYAAYLVLVISAIQCVSVFGVAGLLGIALLGAWALYLSRRESVFSA